MTRACAVTLCLLWMSHALAYAQAPDSERLAFDVVSVKPNTSSEQGLRLGVTPGRVVVVNMPLKQLIRAAYTLQLHQILGAPSWVEAERFDITGITRHDLTTPALWKPGTYAPVQRLLQSVLQDRFRMKARMDEREDQGYSLVRRNPDRMSAGLTAASGPCSAGCGLKNAPGSATARGVPMAQFAELLSQLTGRVVIDATGLAGNYDFNLQWAPDSASVSDAPSLVTALQEQLDLRLEPRRVQVPVLVLESIERPDPD